MGNGQNKKAAPSRYKAGLVTAFKVLTEAGGLSDSHSPNSPPPAPLKEEGRRAKLGGHRLQLICFMPRADLFIGCYIGWSAFFYCLRQINYPGIRNTIVPCELPFAYQHPKATKIEWGQGKPRFYYFSIEYIEESRLLVLLFDNLYTQNPFA